MIKIEKDFNCIQWKHGVQAKLYEETKSMSVKEEIRFYSPAESPDALTQWWKQVKEHAARSTSANKQT